MAPKSPSGMCACSCRGCSAKAKGGMFVRFFIITFRNGMEHLRRYYIQVTNHFTQIQDSVHGYQEDTYEGPEDISLPGHVIFSLPGHVIFSFGK